MACYQCNGCGKCEMGRVFNVGTLDGTCPVCHAANEPDALVCAGCGLTLPKPPGTLSLNRPGAVIGPAGRAL